MKCLIKINELYLKDFDVDMISYKNIFKRIELDSKEYYICESGQEAEFLKFLLTKDLGIEEEKIKIFAVEGYKEKSNIIPGQTNINDFINKKEEKCTN